MAFLLSRFKEYRNLCKSACAFHFRHVKEDMSIIFKHNSDEITADGTTALAISNIKSIEGLAKKDVIGFNNALMEVIINSYFSIRKLSSENEGFCKEKNRISYGANAFYLWAVANNVALDAHAERALKKFKALKDMTCEEGLILFGEHLRSFMKSGSQVDENGLQYNGCGGGLITIRSLCPIFRLSVHPHPEGYDPRLRVVRTVIGVKRTLT